MKQEGAVSFERPPGEGFMAAALSGNHTQPTVLLVEDDEPTRDAMMAVLVREGYLVLTAASGHDTLSVLRAPLSPIDVVLLDVHLPDIAGTDLCARLRQVQPRVPVIVCSGEAEPA